MLARITDGKIYERDHHVRSEHTSGAKRDSLIQDYLAELRILDLEGPSVLGQNATAEYRRRLLQRIAALDRYSRNPSPGPPRKP